MIAETGRLFICGACGESRRLCRRCDHGNVYCSDACSRTRRRETLLRAGAIYQRTRRGARLHAARMQRIRDRQRTGVANILAPKVTHHGLTLDTSGATNGLSSAIAAAPIDSK